MPRQQIYVSKYETICNIMLTIVVGCRKQTTFVLCLVRLHLLFRIVSSFKLSFFYILDVCFLEIQCIPDRINKFAMIARQNFVTVSGSVYTV